MGLLCDILWGSRAVVVQEDLCVLGDALAQAFWGFDDDLIAEAQDPVEGGGGAGGDKAEAAPAACKVWRFMIPLLFKAPVTIAQMGNDSRANGQLQALAFFELIVAMGAKAGFTVALDFEQQAWVITGWGCGGQTGIAAQA